MLAFSQHKLGLRWSLGPPFRGLWFLFWSHRPLFGGLWPSLGDFGRLLKAFSPVFRPLAPPQGGGGKQTDKQKQTDIL